MILLLLAMMWLPHVDSNVEFAMKPLTVQGATSDPKMDEFLKTIKVGSDLELNYARDIQPAADIKCIQNTGNPQP